jgi:hypothetical protein
MRYKGSSSMPVLTYFFHVLWILFFWTPCMRMELLYRVSGTEWLQCIVDVFFLGMPHGVYPLVSGFWTVCFANVWVCSPNGYVHHWLFWCWHVFTWLTPHHNSPCQRGIALWKPHSRTQWECICHMICLVPSWNGRKTYLSITQWT